MKRFISFVAGVITGFAVGGMIASLFAPQSGRDTQSLIRSRFQAMMDDARLAAEQTRAEAQIRLAELKAKDVES